MTNLFMHRICICKVTPSTVCDGPPPSRGRLTANKAHSAECALSLSNFTHTLPRVILERSEGSRGGICPSLSLFRKFVKIDYLRCKAELCYYVFLRREAIE